MGSLSAYAPSTWTELIRDARGTWEMGGARVCGPISLQCVPSASGYTSSNRAARAFRGIGSQYLSPFIGVGYNACG